MGNFDDDLMDSSSSRKIRPQADGETGSPTVRKRPSISGMGDASKDAASHANERKSRDENATERKGRAENATEERRRRPATGKNSAAARNNSGAGRRPDASGRRPDSAGRKTDAGSRRPDASRRKVMRAKRLDKKKTRKFWIGVGIYTGVLLILAIIMLIHTGSVLKKYEKSQPDNAMSEFIKDFEDMVKNNTLVDNISLPASSEFEGKDIFANMYMAKFSGVSSYSFKKNESSYDTEKPVYDIYAGDDKVAQMTLSPKSTHVALAILTYMDWKIDKIEPVFSADTYNYTVAIPEGYTFTVNGIAVSDSYKTGNVYMNPDFTNVSQYVTMPKTVEYKITGFVNKPEIKVYNTSGSEVGYSIDENGNVTLGASGDAGDMPEARKESALEMAKLWDNFLTNDLSGSYHGLAQVQEILIEDSYYWNLASDYSTSADITFISDHTLANPAYTGVVVDNYIEYGENCYSCHIAFTKNMLLTGSGGARTDKIDSTFYFVNVGGKWAIADMIATTE